MTATNQTAPAPAMPPSRDLHDERPVVGPAGTCCAGMPASVGTPVDAPRGAPEAGSPSCCSSAEQASCCEPAEKSACCGGSEPGTCGCR